MTKQIKFNLMLNNHPVKDLEGVTEHFNIDDIYEHFQSGTLLRWLEVRDLDAQVKAVNEIQESASEREAFRKLASIFGMNLDANSLKKAEYVLLRRKEQEKRLEEQKNTRMKKDEIVREYFAEYGEILAKIVLHRDDFVLVKEYVRTMLSAYELAFHLDYMRFWDTMIYAAPLAVFAVLMNKQFRPYYLKNSAQTSDNLCLSTLNAGELIKEVLERKVDCPEIPDDNILPPSRKAFNENLGTLFSYTGGAIMTVGDVHKIPLMGSEHYFSKAVNVLSSRPKTDFWDDIEDSDKKEFMILYLSQNCTIRSHKNTSQKLTPEDVNSKFPILRGIDYICAGPTSRLIYMEV